MDCVSGQSAKADSPLIEINASKQDSYFRFANRASRALNMPQGDTEHVVALYRPGVGSIILNADIVIKGVKKPWSLETYIQKSHRSADSFKFGVGLVQKEVAVLAGLELQVDITAIHTCTVV